MTAHSGHYTLQSRSRTSSRIGVALFLFTSLLIVGAVLFALMQLGSGLDKVALVATLALLASATMAAVAGWRGGVERSAWAAALCGILACLLIFGITMPRLQRLWVADRAAHAVRSVASPGTQTLVVGYHEPSLVFLLGTRTRFADAGEAAAALQAGPATTAIVASSSAPAFARAARARGVDVRRFSTIEGIDPVHARPIELGVWSVRSGPGASRP